MKELNKNILKNGLSKLPDMKAPDKLWDDINFNMTMVLLKDLPEKKAPLNIWEGIEFGLEKRKWYKAIIWILPVALISIMGSWYLFNTDNHEFTEPTTQNAITSKKYNSIVSNNNYMLADRQTINESNAGNLSVVKHESQANNGDPIDKQVVTDDLSFYERTESEFPINADYYQLSKISSVKNASLDIHKSINTLHNNNNITELPPFEYCPVTIENDYLLGMNLGYSFFNKKDLPTDTEIEYWFSGDIRFRFSRKNIWIETGLGTSFSSEKQSFVYDYRKNEIVDSYEYVDSVSFDPQTGQTIYYTTTVEVWDSVAYSSSSSNNIRQNYAYIPLKIGYNFLSTKKLCFDLNIGGNYFFKISETKHSPELYHENSTIHSIYQNQVTRKSQFYNLEAGIGIQYMINDNTIIRLEPAFLYYNDIYKDHNKNQLAYKFNIGMYFKL